MSTQDNIAGIPSVEEAHSWTRQGKAPRLDLDVPRRCCEETLRELARRQWRMAEMADYCDVDESVVSTKFDHIPVDTPTGAGPPNDTHVLWHMHPDALEELL